MQFFKVMRKAATKAETLLFLERKLKHSHVAPLYYFTKQSWLQNPQKHIQELQGLFGDGPVIVRSSAIGEDSYTYSKAGQFCSLQNINSGKAPELAEAINTVFASYEDENKQHQVLIQPMITNVILAGVAFTQDQKSGAPYIVISYDDESTQTDMITSGGVISKSLRIWRGTPVDNLTSKRMRKVYTAIEELESIMESDALDIEFAVDEDYRVWTFQVRPLILEKTLSSSQVENLSTTLEKICEEIIRISKPYDDLYGAYTILSNMSDWNPAEMIGVQPFPLAYSLYHRLITSDIWHQARAGMGYRRMEGHHLMEQLGGHPFIDTRKSFNSFLPNGIEPLTAERLINAWLSRLENNPSLYDKIEFDIVPTCYTPSFDALFAKHYGHVLTDKQYSLYKFALLDLTNNCVNGTIDFNINWCETQGKKLEELQARSNLKNLTSGSPQQIANNIEILIDQCREIGTKAFSAAARHAFIGESILRSCNHLGRISDEIVVALKVSFSTISNTIIASMAQIEKNEASRLAFFSKFGHIRPSSYDILSIRYDEMDNIGKLALTIPQTNSSVKFHISMLKNLDDFFKTHEYKFTAADFVTYYIKAVQMREWIKLIFSRNLSDIIECVAEIGHAYNLDRRSISFVPIDDIIAAVRSSYPETYLANLIEEQTHLRAKHKAVYMNYLIKDPKDLYIIPVQRSIPNFITYKRITAPAIMLTDKESARNDLSGKIVCIERADPGFDWLFGCNIAGLVTKYGGTNSHMAIRCSEFSLPAAIGCGEIIYEKLQGATQIEMDCQTGKIVAL